MKYNCKCCHYSTEDKSNFNKHMSSQKHKLLNEKVEPVENYQEPQESIELKELIKVLIDRLENQQIQLNEQKKQIEYINSEIF